MYKIPHENKIAFILAMVVVVFLFCMLFMVYDASAYELKLTEDARPFCNGYFACYWLPPYDIIYLDYVHIPPKYFLYTYFHEVGHAETFNTWQTVSNDWEWLATNYAYWMLGHYTPYWEYFSNLK